MKTFLPFVAEPHDRDNPEGFSWRVVDSTRCILLDNLTQVEAEWWARAGEYYAVLQRPNPQEIGA